MNQIVLTDEQAKLLASAREPVRVCTANGTVLGVISPLWTDDDIAEAQKILASDDPWYTTEQVLTHLRSLERK